MYSLFFIAKNNLKKHKGEVAILFVLIFLAATLLFSSLSLMLSGENTMKQCEDTYHTSDLLVFESTFMGEKTGNPKADSEAFCQVIANVPGTKMAESARIVEWACDYYYGSRTADDATSYEFFLQNSAEPTYLNAFPEEFENLADNEIVIPYHLKSTIKVGDKMVLKGNGMEFDFTVKGYLENLYFATTMNISGYLVLISPDVFETISAHLEPEATGSFVSCLVEDGVDIDEYDTAVKHAFGENTPNTVSKSVMELGTFAVSGIASSIVLIFTVILVGLALIIMHFSIKNFIEMNIQNIGLLQANGYTAKALRWSCVMEEMLICVAATIAAVIVGILISPPLSSLQGTLMGLTGFSGVCMPALVSTLILIPVMVFLGTLLASRSYKKLTVLESLRSGVSNHNFKKNHFALEKTSMPLDLALSGKSIFGRPKKSIFIALIVALLTFSTCLGFTLFQNFAMDQTSMLKLVGFEAADIQIGSNGNEEILEELKADPDVERVGTMMTISSIEITHLDKSRSVGVDTYRDLDHLEYEYLLEGHLPATENEIVLTFIEADKLDAKIGDVVNAKTRDGSGTVAFTVCGIDQKINNMGNKALVTEDGAKRIDPNYKYGSALVYLKNPTDENIKAFKNKWSEKYPQYSILMIDDLIGSTIDTLTSSMVAICAIFVAMTCFVVVLTEILLTRSQIIRERSELGVSKALGYTSGELIRRVMLSNIPIIVIGILFGFVLHMTLADKFLLLGLNTFGIKQTNLTTNPVWFLVTLLIIVVFALFTSFMSARKISKLEPVRILKDE